MTQVHTHKLLKLHDVHFHILQTCHLLRLNGIRLLNVINAWEKQQSPKNSKITSLKQPITKDRKKNKTYEISIYTQPY